MTEVRVLEASNPVVQCTRTRTSKAGSAGCPHCLSLGSMVSMLSMGSMGSMLSDGRTLLALAVLFGKFGVRLLYESLAREGCVTRTDAL